MSAFTSRWLTWMLTGAAATHGPEPTDKTDETPSGGDWEHPRGQRRPEMGADKTDESTSRGASVSFVSASGPTDPDNTSVTDRAPASGEAIALVEEVFGPGVQVVVASQPAVWPPEFIGPPPTDPQVLMAGERGYPCVLLRRGGSGWTCARCHPDPARSQLRPGPPMPVPRWWRAPQITTARMQREITWAWRGPRPSVATATVLMSRAAQT
jgi:hypothetical protein